MKWHGSLHLPANRVANSTGSSADGECPAASSERGSDLEFRVFRHSQTCCGPACDTLLKVKVRPMKKLVQELIDNESGLILSAELVLVLTIAVLGVVVGLSQVQTAVVTELQDISLAFSGMNQSYSTPAFMGCGKWWGRTAFTAGSGFIDYYDGCVGNGGGGVVGNNYGVGAYGGGYGGGYGFGSTGAYSEIGAGQSTTVTCPNPTAVPQSTPVPQTMSPCETCTPGVVTPTPLPCPQQITPTPEAPSQTVPLPPAPVPVPHTSSN